MKIAVALALLAAPAIMGAEENNAPSYDLKIDGLYYSIREDGLEVARSPYTYDEKTPLIPHAEYAGDIIVPEEVYVPTLDRKLPVVSVALSAFSACDSLHTVKLPGSIIDFGEAIFAGSKALTSVDMSECKNLTTITADMFFITPALESIILPQGTVKEIEEFAFQGCGITYFAVPDDVTSLGRYAFSSSSLKHLKMGKSLTMIGEGALSCKLEQVEWNDCLYTVGYRGMSWSSLTRLELPASIRRIASEAFAGMKNLEAVVCPVENPDLIRVSEHAFTHTMDSSVPENCVLYVPEQSVELYRTADVWQKFSEIRAIGDEETSLTDVGTMPADGNDATYDLMGRRVASPRPGQPVVSGGKLRIIR